ncbi:MAG: nucleotide exchange factor GrpE [Treponema sp.]|jgi:molecular chaperone GrpE|nr:nucleotide exchange factor GrpE [Treponema sp.]
MHDTITDTAVPEEAAAAASPEEQTDVPAAQTPEEKIGELEAQIAGLKDQYLRKAAEFENFRKRMNREKQEAIEFANQSLLLDMIPIIDDFERAIKSAESLASPSPDCISLCEGIGMIEKRLTAQLENKWGLKRYDSAGEIFDPNRHEAIMMEKSPDVSEPTVREDMLKGYTLKDRVIRSAKVKVVMPENPDTEDAGEEDRVKEE